MRTRTVTIETLKVGDLIVPSNPDHQMELVEFIVKNPTGSTTVTVRNARGLQPHIFPEGIPAYFTVTY